MELRFFKILEGLLLAPSPPFLALGTDLSLCETPLSGIGPGCPSSLLEAVEDEDEAGDVDGRGTEEAAERRRCVEQGSAGEDG